MIEFIRQIKQYWSKIEFGKYSIAAIVVFYPLFGYIEKLLPQNQFLALVIVIVYGYFLGLLCYWLDLVIDKLNTIIKNQEKIINNKSI